MNLSSTNIILGSGSPRRKQLLEELGWKFETVVRSTSEEMPSHLKRDKVAIHLAEMKAAAFDGDLKSNDLLITADTIVCLDDRILNKPENEKEALQMLQALSGRKHEVYTGVCLSTSKSRNCFSVESRVHFKKINDFEIIEYIRKYKPFDKAGSYGAQECLQPDMNPCSPEELKFINRIGRPDYVEKTLTKSTETHYPIIDKIEGSFFNVMGLPVVELWNAVEKLLSE
ncbi:MAG: septum formation protein Maf [Bacteroidetes bacterium]|nr:MAG: septum formation protein Maf [Bacteroidota bacterium]